MPKNEDVHAKNSRGVVPEIARGIIDLTDRRADRYRKTTVSDCLAPCRGHGNHLADA